VEEVAPPPSCYKSLTLAAALFYQLCPFSMSPVVTGMTPPSCYKSLTLAAALFYQLCPFSMSPVVTGMT